MCSRRECSGNLPMQARNVAPHPHPQVVAILPQKFDSPPAGDLEFIGHCEFTEIGECSRSEPAGSLPEAIPVFHIVRRYDLAVYIVAIAGAHLSPRVFSRFTKPCPLSLCIVGEESASLRARLRPRICIRFRAALQRMSRNRLPYGRGSVTDRSRPTKV
jgi:hypothetical protein